MKYSLLLLPLFFSCSYLVDSFENDFLAQNNIQPKETTEQTTCNIIQKNMLINESASSQETFNNILTEISSRHFISFIDRLVLWSFAQINLRPDLNSPHAKLQILLNFNGKETYYNSFSQNKEDYSYFHLLESLLKKYKSRHTLKELASFFDQYNKLEFKVTSSFEAFLNENKLEISKSRDLRKFYIRGDETLKENEGITRVGIVNLVNQYNKSKHRSKENIQNFLFNFTDLKKVEPFCNFDMNLYKDSIFLINEKKVQSHTFGMHFQGNTFMAVSSQNIESIESYKSTPVFKGQSNVRAASLCSFRDKTQKDKRLWLVSANSRHPGQHLYHLVEYGIEDTLKLQSLDNMLRFSRHLFLKNPVRLIIESRRSNKGQIKELLKLDIPIYNSKKLGQIWGFYQGPKEHSFLLDARRQGSIDCNSK